MRQALRLLETLAAAPQLVLRLAPNGDVDARADHVPDVAVDPAQRRERGVDGEHPAARRRHAGLEARRLAAAGPRDRLGDPRALVGGMREPVQLDEALPHDVRAMEASGRQRRLIGVEQDAVEREEPHEGEQRVEHVAEPRLQRDPINDRHARRIARLDRLNRHGCAFPPTSTNRC